MRINVSAILLALAFFAALLVLVVPVSAAYNATTITHINTLGAATPFDIWIFAQILGWLLFFVSLTPSQESGELERNAMISVLAWIPIGFTAYASFAVDRLTSTGIVGSDVIESHTLYSFDVLGVLYGIFFVIAIVNTVRIVALHRALRLQSDDGGSGGMSRGQGEIR
jgi:hypothetical protein